jgi:ATP-binding cassette subfamily B protein
VIRAAARLGGVGARAAAGSRAAADNGPEDRWLLRLAAACWRYPRGTILALCGALLATLMAAVIPLIQRNIIDDAILARKEPIWPGAALLVVVALLNFGGAYVRRYQGGRVSLDVQHDLRTELFGALTHLDGARQDQLHTGQVVSRSISDLAMVQGMLAMVPVLFSNALQFMLSVAIMAVLSPQLTLIALAIGPAVWLIAIRSRHRLFPATWEEQQQAANVAGVVEGAVSGVRVVKGFGQEEQEIERVEEACGWLYASRVRAVRLMAMYNPALQAVPALGQVGVLVFGCWLAIHGSISIGTFFAFSAYLAQLIGPVRTLTGMVTIGQEVRASVMRVYEVIDSRPVLTEKPDAVRLPPGDLDIELDDVSFGYLPAEPVLRGLSLRARSGETLAVVGTSGSGKSTISLLLPRFYDVNGGAVRVGGHDVRDLSISSLRASVGLVLEEAFLFSDTVRANIAYGRPDATEKQVIEAAQAAAADEFITALPEGYDTIVGEQGCTLSGGQRQRISLARALITDPAILVLDDATSAIDAKVEARIHAALRKAKTGQTRLLIAHRRSTLQLADRIAVLDDGRLVDEGTDQELAARCPVYRSLLAAPGDDADHVDSSEPTPSGHRAEQPADLAAEADGGARARSVLPGMWGRAASPDQHADLGVPGEAALSRSGAPVRRRMANLRYGTKAWARQRRSGVVTSMLAGVPPTPELLAKVAALPPANDVPEVSRRWARAADPHFTLRRLLKPFALAAAIGLILDALDTLAGIAMPALVRNGIENGVLAHAFDAVILIAIVALAIVLADWVINIVQTQLVGRNGERLLYTLRVKVFSQLQRLGLDFYEHEGSGRIMTRMTTDIDSLSSFLQIGLITLVNSALSLVGVMIALLFINARLGLVLLSILPVLAIVTVVFRARSSKAYRDAREDVSAVNADLQENVAGLRVTQAYRREQMNQDQFVRLSRTYLTSRLRAQRYIALYFPFVQVMSTIGGALVLFVASSELHNRALTAGGLIAYLLYIDLLFSPMQQLSLVFDSYQQANVGLQRIKALLRTPGSTAAAAEPVPAGQLRGLVELRDVHFRYPRQRAESVAGVSFSIAPGETVALVGQSGAGKSTLVKLIARFYDVSSGSVLVDGVDIRDYDLADYRHQLGLVPQEPYLFSGTVRDAIAYGRPGASDAEIEAAARGIGATEMIARLSGGFMHEVSERGRNLSAGQRQGIALIRAHLVNPAVLLLDEATAALDLAAETAVARATHRLEARRTTLVVAHRLAAAVPADRIIVMDSGRIVETGTHAELLAAGGTYTAMWAAYVGEAELAA